MDHSHSKEMLPNAQSQAPLLQLKSIPTPPTTGYQKEEITPVSPPPLLRKLKIAMGGPLSQTTETKSI